MKCINCGSTMTTKRENVPYKALPGTTLVGVEVSRCAECGELEVAIPAIDELNRVLARAVIERKRHLLGPEIRFLRTYLGYSSADFAKVFSVTPETVSRWENEARPMGSVADRLLRALVVMDKKVEEYPISYFTEIDDEAKEKKGPAYALALRGTKWRPTEVGAASS